MIEDDITVPIFDYSFYRGDFYLGFKLAMNLAGLLLIAGVLMALLPALRAAASDPGDEPRRRSSCCSLPADACGAGFRVAGAAAGACSRDPWGRWSFVSYPMSVPLRGLSDGLLENVHGVNWWAHFLTTFVFLGYFAYSKMIHVFTSLTNVFFRRLRAAGRADADPRTSKNAESFGIGKLDDFTWAQLMNVDACMHCGRCLEYLPDLQHRQAAAAARSGA